MTETFDILWQGKRTGKVVMRRDGAMTVLDAQIDRFELPEDEVLYLTAVCKTGSARIGVPAPENGSMRLYKRLSPLELAGRGLTKPEYFVLSRAGGEPEKARAELGRWREEYDPGRLLEDAELSRACENVLGALVRDCGEGVTALAVPVDTHQPFPLLPVFVFGEVEEIEGRMYVVFKIRDREIIA